MVFVIICKNVLVLITLQKKVCSQSYFTKIFVIALKWLTTIVTLFVGAEIANRHAQLFADEDLDTSRRRAEKHIREEHLFDSRGGRIGRGASLLNSIENGFNDEVRRFFD